MEIWSNAFVNYSMEILDFFNATFPSRVCALPFQMKICKSSEIYDKQKGIFPLAINIHTEVTAVNHTDTDAWILS